MANLTEVKESKKMHTALFVYVGQHLVPQMGHYREFEAAADSYVEPADIARATGAIDILHAMERRGHIDVGKYNNLTDLLGTAKLVDLKNHVEKEAESISRQIELEDGAHQDISSGLPDQNICSSTIREQSECFRAYCREKTGTLFVKTTLCCEAEDLLKSENALILIGNSGDGKSFILWYLAANTEYLPVECSTPEGLEAIINENMRSTNKQMLLVVDEPFGGSYTQHKLVDKWVNMVAKLEKYLKLHKFVFATRKAVWSDVNMHLDKTSFFCNAVDVTSENLTAEDKRSLLRKYSNDIGNLNDTQVEYIVSEAKVVAYNQCCKLMKTAIDKGMSGAELVKIFDHPFSFLCSDLETLADREKVKYATLCFIMLCGGEIKRKELDSALSSARDNVKERVEAVREACGCPDISVGGLKRCAEKLTGIYVEKVQRTGENSRTWEAYTFLHDSIHEAVVMHYGKHHFSYCLKLLHRDVIVQIVRPTKYEPSEHEFVVCIPTDDYHEVAEVFTKMAIQETWALHCVFENPCVRNKEFCRHWWDYLKSHPDELATLGKSTSWDGCCVFHLAAFTECYWLMNYLEFSCSCRKLDTPLCLAATRGDTECVGRLLGSQNVTDDQVCQAVYSSCRAGNVEVLKMLFSRLLSNGERLAKIVPRCFHVVCLSGQQKVVVYLLDNYHSRCRQDMCFCGKGLRAASREGHTKCVHTLWSHGVEINSADGAQKTSLYLAARNGKTGTVHYLLYHGADVHTKSIGGWTCLHAAASEGHTDILYYLITRGGDINIRTTDGDTCIRLAARGGHTFTVEYLVNQGADINSTNEFSNTCLQAAVFSGNPDTVRYFVAHDAEMNTKDDDGDGILHEAAHYGYTDTVRYLVTEGALLDVGNINQVTPLHMSAYWGHLEIATILIENGADVNMTDYWGQTALHVLMRDFALQQANRYLQVFFELEEVDDIIYNIKWNRTTRGLAKHMWITFIEDFLYRYGIDKKKLEDSQGRNPDETDTDDMKQTGRYLEVVEAFLKHGANVDMTDKSNRSTRSLVKLLRFTDIEEVLDRYRLDTKTLESAQETQYDKADEVKMRHAYGFRYITMPNRYSSSNIQ